MKLLIDSANIEEIKKAYDYLDMDGVTCNPTILKRVGKDPYETLIEIREFIGYDQQLHVQVVSLDSEKMLEEAKRIVDKLGKDTYIKVPVTKEGLKAIKKLVKLGYNVTGTAIYNQMQGYLAAKAGAKYLAPYVNRIDNMGYNGVDIAKQIHDILRLHNYDCDILAASFKNSHQVLDLALYGLGAATVSLEVIDKFIDAPMIENSVLDFKEDFESLCGKDSLM